MNPTGHPLPDLASTDKMLDFRSKTQSGSHVVSGDVAAHLGLPHTSQQAVLTGQQVLEMFLGAVEGKPEPAKAGGCDCEHEVDYKIPGTGCGCSTAVGTATPDILALDYPGQASSWEAHFRSEKPGCYWPVSDPDALLSLFGHGSGAAGTGGADRPDPKEYPGWDLPLSDPPTEPPTGTIPVWVPPPPQAKECCCCALTLKARDFPELADKARKAGHADPLKVQREQQDPATGKWQSTVVSLFSVEGTFENKTEPKTPGKCILEWWEWTDNSTGNDTMKGFGLSESRNTWNNFSKAAADTFKKPVKKGDAQGERNKQDAIKFIGGIVCGGECPEPKGTIGFDDPAQASSINGSRKLFIAAKLRHGGECKEPCPAEPPAIYFSQVVVFENGQIKSFEAKKSNSDFTDAAKANAPK